MLVRVWRYWRRYWSPASNRASNGSWMLITSFGCPEGRDLGIPWLPRNSDHAHPRRQAGQSPHLPYVLKDRTRGSWFPDLMLKIRVAWWPASWPKILILIMLVGTWWRLILIVVVVGVPWPPIWWTECGLFIWGSKLRAHRQLILESNNFSIGSWFWQSTGRVWEFKARKFPTMRSFEEVVRIRRGEQNVGASFFEASNWLNHCSKNDCCWGRRMIVEAPLDGCKSFDSWISQTGSDLFNCIIE